MDVSGGGTGIDGVSNWDGDCPTKLKKFMLFIGVSDPFPLIDIPAVAGPTFKLVRNDDDIGVYKFFLSL